MVKKSKKLVLGVLFLVTGFGLQAKYQAVVDREDLAEETRDHAQQLMRNNEDSAAAARRLHTHAGYLGNHAQTEAKESKHMGATKAAHENAHAGYEAHRKCATKAEHPIRGQHEVKKGNSDAIRWAKGQDNGQTILAAQIRDYMESQKFNKLSTFKERCVRSLSRKLNCNGSMTKKEFNTLVVNNQRAVKLVYDFVMGE